jgi:hypothetical protein
VSIQKIQSQNLEPTNIRDANPFYVKKYITIQQIQLPVQTPCLVTNMWKYDPQFYI